MHRSGTSFCVRTLQRYGVAVPTNLLPAANDNPDGFLEPAELVSLNERLLHAEGALWDASWPIGSAEPTRLRDNVGCELQVLLEQWCNHTKPQVQPESSNQLLALKDPRLCRTFPLIAPYLDSDTFWHGLAVIRNPNAVIASLLERNQDDMSPLKGLALWMRYNLDMVKSRHLKPDINQWPIVQFEALIHNPSNTLKPILEQWQKTGFNVKNQPNDALICRPAKERANYLESLPDQWVQLALTFHSTLQQSTTLGDVPNPLIQTVEHWLEHTPDLTHQLLAQEATRRAHLGEALSAERKLSWRNL